MITKGIAAPPFGVFSFMLQKNARQFNRNVETFRACSRENTGSGRVGSGLIGQTAQERQTEFVGFG